MDKLSATLAFSRRMARRLGAGNVAAELSKLIHAVSQLDQSLHDHPDSPSTYQFSDQAALSETISDSSMAKKRRKKRAQSVELSCAGEPRNEHLGADSKDQVEEVLTAEHDVENLRAVIRERLHTVSRNEQGTFLQAMCRQSFGIVAASADQLIEIQVFKARLHLIYLEEHMKLAPTTRSQFQLISN